MSRKRVLLYIIAIYTIILVISNVACCKKTLHFDELFSYGSANTPYSYAEMVGNREWKNPQSMFSDYLCVNDNDRFNFRMVWNNQSNDVHPPLYYAIIHTVCSFIPNSFSIWIAAFINLFFFLLTIPAVFKICLKLYNDENLALIVCFVFSASNMMIGITMFLRMYVLLLCITTWLVCYHFIWLEDSSKKNLISIYTLSVLGLLTHYYFVVFIFILTCGMIILLLTKKEISRLLQYIFALGFAGLTFICVYPACIQHIFHGYRGDEAFRNIRTLNHYSDVLVNYFNQLGSGMFGIVWNSGSILIIILAFFIFFGVINRKKGNYNLLNYQYFLLLAVVAVAYFFVITKISSIQDRRYLAPIFPLLYILLFGCLYTEIKSVVKERYVAVIFIVAALGFFNWNAMLKNNIPDNVQIAQEHYGKKCILLSSSQEDWYRSYEALNNYYQLINFSECMFIAQPFEAPFVDQQLLSATELIVYFDSQDDAEQYQKLLLDTLPRMSKYTFLYEASGATVYLLH